MNRAGHDGDRADRLVLEQLEAAIEASAADGDATDTTSDANGATGLQAADSAGNPVLDSECSSGDSPIEAVSGEGKYDSIEYYFESEEYEDDWSWYVDTNHAGEGNYIAHEFTEPGIYTISLREPPSTSSATGPGSVMVQRELCLKPFASIEEIDPTGVDPLEYLEANDVPTGEGVVHWFSGADSFTSEADDHEWSVTAIDGGGEGDAEILAPNELVTPIRYDRPGEFRVRLTITTSGGLQSERTNLEFVEPDPEVEVENWYANGDDHFVQLRAHHQFLHRDDVTNRWYLDDQDGDAYSGETVAMPESSANLSVRLALERPDGETTEVRAPLVGDVRSRWHTGATITTSEFPDAVAGLVGNNKAALATHKMGDLLIVEEPSVVRFTAGQEDRPAWRQPPHKWSVKYSERFRDGPEERSVRIEQGDLQTEYSQSEDEYEPTDGELLYPFTEPGWYAVELELRYEDAVTNADGTEADVPWDDESTDGKGRSPWHDWMLVYVMGLEAEDKVGLPWDPEYDA